MRIIAFAGSTSKKSINKQLVEFAASYFIEEDLEILDLNDFEMPVFSVDKEAQNGIPKEAFTFSSKLEAADLVLISLAEHNGAYSAAFKNVLDWASRIPSKTVFHDKGIFLMATSPGPRGGSSVLEMAKNRFPFNGGNVLETFSLPSFSETFESGKGIRNETLKEELETKIEKIKFELQ
jgi:chromate reductase, NAD(P)H dehydrogenase (quinone)